MNFLSEKIAKAKDDAKEAFGMWVTYSDLQPWKPSFFPLSDNMGNDINGGGRIDFTLDVNGKFVWSKADCHVWNEDNLTYVPELADGHKLQWRDKDRGQIKWAKLGKNAQASLKKVYESSGKRSWRYFYNRKTNTLNLTASLNGKQVLNLALSKQKGAGSQVVYDSEDDASTNLAGDNKSDNSKVSPGKERKEEITPIDPTVSSTKERRGEIIPIEPKVSPAQTKREEIQPESLGPEVALLDYRDVKVSERERPVLKVEGQCSAGGSKNHLAYFKRKKDQMFTNLHRDMVDLRCGASENSGCNGPEVFNKLMSFRTQYESLAKEVKEWQNQAHVPTPELCSQLYLK